jgi:hypothetical protein
MTSQYQGRFDTCSIAAQEAILDTGTAPGSAGTGGLALQEGRCLPICCCMSATQRISSLSQGLWRM